MSEMTKSDREYDVVLYGATGFVGSLVAAELARPENDHLKMALAGRNADKLAQIATSVPRATGWGTVIAQASDRDEVTKLAQSGRVVITTVGPYARHGLPLAQACARLGTHYVDLTGEVLFHRDVIDSCQDSAVESGARIVPSCGFDSVPSDLGVFELARAARKAGDGELTDTTLYASMKGGMSGGTVASAMQQADDIAADPARRRIAGDKFALSPAREQEPAGEFRDSLATAYSDDIKAWTGPFLMASYNKRVVRRSNALLGHLYGPAFRYREVLRTGVGRKGRVKAVITKATLAAGFTALAKQQIRPLVERLVPAPGTGPDEAARNAGFFKMDIRSRTTHGVSYRSVVSAQGDPGYKATAVMLAQAGLTLAEDELPALPDNAAGGVVTPAVGLGQPYIERLRRNGFTIETSTV